MLDSAELPLFSYPRSAGFKTEGTSKDAALKIERTGRAEALRTRVLFALKYPATSKELAEMLGETILSIRPRLSELKNRNLIAATGIRRHSENEWISI